MWEFWVAGNGGGLRGIPEAGSLDSGARIPAQPRADVIIKDRVIRMAAVDPNRPAAALPNQGLFILSASEVNVFSGVRLALINRPWIYAL
jgi:hypothetical protein